MTFKHLCLHKEPTCLKDNGTPANVYSTSGQDTKWCVITLYFVVMSGLQNFNSMWFFKRPVWLNVYYKLVHSLPMGLLTYVHWVMNKCCNSRMFVC